MVCRFWCASNTPKVSFGHLALHQKRPRSFWCALTSRPVTAPMAPLLSGPMSALVAALLSALMSALTPALPPALISALMTLLTPALISALTASTGAYFRHTPKYNKTNSKHTPNSYGAFGVTVWCHLASLLDTKKGRRFGVTFGVREKRALHGFAVLVWCAVWCRLV